MWCVRSSSFRLAGFRAASALGRECVVFNERQDCRSGRWVRKVCLRVVEELIFSSSFPAEDRELICAAMWGDCWLRSNVYSAVGSGQVVFWK